MLIQIDTREKPKAIQGIIREFDKAGVEWYRSKLYVGDYMDVDNRKLVIDRKQSLFEVALNVVQDRRRFVDEINRANGHGYHMIVLVEHGGKIKTLGDVMNWVNPRLKESPMAVSGERLYRIMSVMSKTYDFEWEFCDKNETGSRIIELLERGV